MAKFQSPLLGYNNNVRHKNRLFHLQTEDSGVNHPHIITHLFMDGGRILKSVKKSYAEHVGVEGMSEIVKSMMKEQHKAMFIALRDGQFDHIVDEAAPVKPATKSSEILAPAPPAAPTTDPEPLRLESTEIAPVTIDDSRRPSKQAALAAIAEVPPAAPTDPRMNLPPPSSKPMVRMPEQEEVPTTTREPAPAAAIVSAASLTVDFDALERASNDGAAPAASSLFSSNDLPPPPKNLFAKEPGTGKYSAVDNDAKAPASVRGGTAPPSQSRPTAGSRPPSTKPASSEGRYAPSRPAAIFGSSTNRPQPHSSIFGDELLSDKSLDEVILSYLAEDLEPPRRK